MKVIGTKYSGLESAISFFDTSKNDFLDCNLDQLYINGYKVIKKI